MKTSDLIPPAHRLVLEIAREKGRFAVVTHRRGVEVEGDAALKRHADDMVRDGWLKRCGQSGTRMVELQVTYEATEPAKLLLEAVERIERLARSGGDEARRR